MTKSPKALLIVPANNTTMEPEIAALCPEVSDILVARVPMRTLSADGMAAYGEATIDAAAPFLFERPDIVVHGCTAGGFLAGPEGNARIVAQLERATGAPVVSTADAMVEALRHDDVRNTAVVTPYLPSVNDGLTRYLNASGIQVETLASFLCESIEALCAVTEPQVLQKALATVTPQSRALFIACSQLPTLDIIAPLRERLRIPVWSSIRATAWAVSRRLAAMPSDAQSAARGLAPALQAAPASVALENTSCPQVCPFGCPAYCYSSELKADSQWLTTARSSHSAMSAISLHPRAATWG